MQELGEIQGFPPLFDGFSGRNEGKSTFLEPRKGFEWQKALLVFSRCPQPTVVTYGAVLSALEKGQKWREA